MMQEPWEMLSHPDPDMSSFLKFGEQSDEKQIFADVFDWQDSPIPTKTELKKEVVEDGPYEMMISWKSEESPSSELLQLQDLARQEDALIAELASDSYTEESDAKPYTHSDFIQALSTRAQLRKAKKKLVEQMQKGATINQVSLSRLPAPVVDRFALEEKLEDDIELKQLQSATIVPNEFAIPKIWKYKGVTISESITPLETLQSLAVHLGIDKSETLLASDLVQSITETLRGRRKFFGTTEVTDVQDHPIYTKQQVDDKWKSYKMRMEKLRSDRKSLSTTSTISEVLPSGQTSSSVLAYAKEEETEPEDMGGGGLGFGSSAWFGAAPQIAGKSYNQALDQLKEGILKVLIDNYFVRQPDLIIMGSPDPINAILPAKEINYVEKLKRIDFLFGKSQNERLNMKNMFQKWLEKTPHESMIEKRDEGRLPDFRHLSAEQKTQLAWKLAARASPRAGDFIMMERLLTSIPYDVDLAVRDKETGETLLMHAISKGKYLDVDDPNSDSDPFRMVALILSAAKAYGARGGGGVSSQINLNAVDNAGNNLGLILGYKCNKLHIEAAELRNRYSASQVSLREEEERKAKMLKELGKEGSRGRYGLFGSAYDTSPDLSASPSSSSTQKEEDDKYTRVLPDDTVNATISKASQKFHATLVALLRPDAVVNEMSSLFPLLPSRTTYSSSYSSSSLGSMDPVKKPGVCDAELGIIPLDINYANNGITFGSLCASSNCYLCLRCIQVHSKPDFSIPDQRTGMTALDYAVRVDNILMVHYILAEGSVNFLNVNKRKENVFHHAARHRWNQCYERHPGQREIMKMLRPESGEAPSMLQLLWRACDGFLKSYVNTEVNEKVRALKYGLEAKQKLSEDEERNPKLYGSSTTIFLSDTKAKTDKSRLGATLEAETIEKLKTWKQERLRQLRSFLFDTLNVDGVTPLWESALKRDFNSFEFFIMHKADPTIKNRPDEQGINLQDVLVDLLPDDTDPELIEERKKIIVLLGQVASEIAMTRRIKESELRAFALTPEEMDATPSTPDTKSTMDIRQKRWEDETKDLYDKLVKELQTVDPTKQKRVRKFMQLYETQTLDIINSEATSDRMRRLRLASRRVQAEMNDAKKIERLISQIEDLRPEPRAGEWLLQRLAKEDSLKWLSAADEEWAWEAPAAPAAPGTKPPSYAR